MLKYIVKRILYLIPILFGVSIIIFGLKTFTPGDPARQILGNSASEAQVQEKREELPTSPAATDKSITIGNPISPFAAQIPASGMITPAGNPGKFKYSSNTIRKIKNAPYSIK